MDGAGAGARYLCDGCGRDLSGLAFAISCLCGSTQRRRVDPDGAVFRRPLAAGLLWDPFKDWAVKYLQFTWNVAQLRRLYAPGSGAQADEVRGIVEQSLSSCSDLAEWLSSGPEPMAVIPGDVARLISVEPICICVALAARAGDSNAAARSRIVAAGFTRQPRFWVEYQRAGAKTTRYDALELAERSLRAWQSFLTERGVALPSWQG